MNPTSSTRQQLGRLALLSAITFLQACGGASDGASEPGGAGQPPPPPPPPAASFSLDVSAEKAVVHPGGTLPVTVTVRREAGFIGAVVLSASALPNGVTLPGVVVAADASSAVLTVAAAAEAPHSLPTVAQIQGSAGALARTVGLGITVRGTPGAVDTSFAGGQLTSAFSERDDYLEAMALQDDGKLVVAGHTTVSGSGSDFAVARYLRDGGLDASFGNGGRLTTAIAEGTRGDQALAVAIDTTGRILVAGSSDGGATGRDFALVRYLADGRLDTSFGNGGKLSTSFGNDQDRALAILVMPDGKIVLGGESNQGGATGQDFALARYHDDGRLDASFGTGGRVLTAIASFGGKDSVRALGRQMVDGQETIVAVGGEADFVLARYGSDGQLDTRFGTGGTLNKVFNGTTGSAHAVVVDPAGKLLVAGHRDEDFALLRLNADGTLDSSFGSAGKLVRAVSATDWDQATALALQADGKIVVGGWAFADTGPLFSHFALLRYSAEGVLDERFGNAGTVITAASPRARNSAGRTMLLQADTRVPTVRAVMAGEAVDTANDFALVRYWL